MVRLQGSQEKDILSSSHVPVMTGEVLEAFSDSGDGVFVDGTLGLGGHAEAILDTYDGLSLLGVDLDSSEFSGGGRSMFFIVANGENLETNRFQNQKTKKSFG